MVREMRKAIITNQVRTNRRAAEMYNRSAAHSRAKSVPSFRLHSTPTMMMSSPLIPPPDIALRLIDSTRVEMSHFLTVLREHVAHVGLGRGMDQMEKCMQRATHSYSYSYASTDGNGMGRSGLLALRYAFDEFVQHLYRSCFRTHPHVGNNDAHEQGLKDGNGWMEDEMVDGYEPEDEQLQEVADGRTGTQRSNVIKSSPSPSATSSSSLPRLGVVASGIEQLLCGMTQFRIVLQRAAPILTQPQSNVDEGGIDEVEVEAEVGKASNASITSTSSRHVPDISAAASSAAVAHSFWQSLVDEREKWRNLVRFFVQMLQHQVKDSAAASPSGSSSSSSSSPSTSMTSSQPALLLLTRLDFNDFYRHATTTTTT